MTKRRCFWMLAALSLACGRSPRHAPGVPTAGPDSTTRHDSIGGRGVARALAFGTGVQSGVQSGVQEAPPAEPTASYPSVKAACDSAQVWLRRTLDTTVVRHDGAFTNEFVDGPRHGCVLDVEGQLSNERKAGPDNDVMDRFVAGGWVPELHISADGPDGSDYGLRSRDVLCIAQFQWDGGDDSDSTVVPGDWYTLKLVCTRWISQDTVFRWQVPKRPGSPNPPPPPVAARRDGGDTPLRAVGSVAADHTLPMSR
jgi:hypothetical protein